MKRLLFLTILLISVVAAKAQLTTTTVTEDLKVWCEMPTIIADGKTVNTIHVFENHPGNTYSGFQMVFCCPKGLSTAQVKQGRNTVDDIHLTERGSETHMISCNWVDDGTVLKVMSFSTQNDDYYADTEDGEPLDEIFTVGLIASPDLKSGEYDVTIEDIKFAYASADACKPADEPIHVTMVVDNPNNVSGVEEIDLDALNPDDCYDLNGRKVDPTLVRGQIVVSKGNKFIVK